MGLFGSSSGIVLGPLDFIVDDDPRDATRDDAPRDAPRDVLRDDAPRDAPRDDACDIFVADITVDEASLLSELCDTPLVRKEVMDFEEKVRQLKLKVSTEQYQRFDPFWLRFV